MDPNVLALVLGLVTLAIVVLGIVAVVLHRRPAPEQPQRIINTLTREEIVALYSQIVLAGLDDEDESHEEILNRLAKVEQRQDAQDKTNGNVKQQLAEDQDALGLLRKDLDLLTRDHDELVLDYNGHGHNAWTGTLSSIRKSWILVGALLGFIAGVVFNVLVDDGTVVGNVYNSNNDQWTVIIFTTIGLTLIGAVAGAVASAFAHNGKTSRPQVNAVNQVTVTHRHTSTRG